MTEETGPNSVLVVDDDQLSPGAKVVRFVEAADGRRYPVDADVAEMLQPGTDAGVAKTTDRHDGTDGYAAAPQNEPLTGVDRGNPSKRAPGRPALPIDAEFSSWFALHRQRSSSARSKRRWWWVWAGHKALAAANEDGTFTWLLDKPLTEVASILAEVGRFARSHGSNLTEKVVGVICRKQMPRAEALAHIRNARQLFDKYPEDRPVVRPAAWDRRPSAGDVT